MKVSGATTKLKDKELFGMLKAMFIKVNLKTIWPMVMESTLTLMGQNTKENSKMMCKKDTEKKNG